MDNKDMDNKVMHSRIQPRETPYPSEIASILKNFPQGPDGPIRLFRILAHSERALKKIASGGLLDKKSPLSIKQREIVILRTSANLSDDYEWGIHILSFAKKSELSEKQNTNTCNPVLDSSLWADEELVLLKVTDSLCRQANIDEELWNQSYLHYELEQIMEVLMLVGFYHSIAFLNNTFGIEQETGTPFIIRDTL